MHQKSWSYSETWHMMEVIIFHSGLFFALLDCNSPKIENFKKLKKYLKLSSFYPSVPKSMIMCYTVAEIWHVTKVIILFHSRLFFAVFYPLTAPKMKAIAGDIIILVKCIKNHDHMLFCSWDMAHDGCSYFSF